MVKTFVCKLLVHCLAFLIHIGNSIRKTITASVRPLYILSKPILYFSQSPLLVMYLMLFSKFLSKET